MISVNSIWVRGRLLKSTVYLWPGCVLLWPFVSVLLQFCCIAHYVIPPAAPSLSFLFFSLLTFHFTIFLSASCSIDWTEGVEPYEQHKGSGPSLFLLIQISWLHSKVLQHSSCSTVVNTYFNHYKSKPKTYIHTLKHPRYGKIKISGLTMNHTFLKQLWECRWCNLWQSLWLITLVHLPICTLHNTTMLIFMKLSLNTHFILANCWILVQICVLEKYPEDLLQLIYILKKISKRS